MSTKHCCASRLKLEQLLWIAPLLIGTSLYAADKLSIQVNHQTISAFRTVDLEAAKKEAAAAHKPIAWIATSPKVVDGQGSISLENSRGATLHAFLALHTRTVLVYMDAYEENHKVLPIVDEALHTPDPHYTPPTVVLLDPEAKRVLAKISYEPDFTKRAHALAKGLAEAEGKM